MKFNNANAHYELNLVDKAVTWLLKPLLILLMHTEKKTWIFKSNQIFTSAGVG